jgi:hypothetical protein
MMAVGRLIIILVLMAILPAPVPALSSSLSGGIALPDLDRWASASFKSMQEPSTEEGAKPGSTVPAQKVVDTVHEHISRSLLASAEWLDSFFEDKRTTSEANRSYIRFRYDIFREVNSFRTEHVPSFSLHLRLPQLERKVNLEFESEPLVTSRGTPPLLRNTGAQVTPNQEENISAALQYFFRRTTEESMYIRTGVKFRMGPPAPFIGPRYRKLIHLDKWDLRYTQEVLYRTDTEWEVESLFDLERKLPYDLFFRSFIDGVWHKDAKGYFYNIGCTLFQPFDATNALLYGWTNSFATSPTHELKEVNLSVSYRRSFWRQWLFFELIPQIRFPRETHFKATPGILLRLEMFMGDVNSEAKKFIN